MFQLKCKCGAVLGESSVEQADYGVQCAACFVADAPKRARNDALAFLAETDYLMPRAFEDAVAAGEIDLTRLPQATQKRYADRQAARAIYAGSA